MDSEKLIECVRQHTVLYDLSSPKYMDSARWNTRSIPDCYRKSKKRKLTKSGQPASKIVKYKYDDQLSFLIPFLKERSTISNNPEEEPRLMEEALMDECSNDENSTIDKGTNKRTEDDPEIISNRICSIYPNEIYFKRKGDNSESKVHPVDAFLAGIAPTLKTLDVCNLNAAKSKIFVILQEAEMTQYMQQ
ncbi:hypothetical protein ABEB36_009393 [Hypothenemus hampei]|uniref:BESS domain-containing protein n=1 Tax=Hypothenemus hampei TaxID=57062 RepID=A0ABD1EG80_HYPHA